MNRRRLRWIPVLLGKLALATAMLLIAGLALEIGLRIMEPRLFPDAAASSDRSPIFVYPEAGRLHPWARDTPDPLRVALIGDSFTLGAGVQADDAYSARLERLLNMNDQVCPAMVRVFGRCGTSTFQQLGYLREALEWRPQVIILGICLNDTEDWTAYEELQAWRQEMTPREPGPRMQRLMRASRLCAWGYRQAEYVRCQPAFIRYYQRLYASNYSGWGRFVDALELFRNDCANEGAAFGVMIFPLLSAPFDKNRYPFEFAHESIHAQLEAFHIPYLDLLETFRGKQPVRMQAIPVVDPHPSEIAHRMAAETLLAWLLARNFIDGAYGPRQTTMSEQAGWDKIRERMLLTPMTADKP